MNRVVNWIRYALVLALVASTTTVVAQSAPIASPPAPRKKDVKMDPLALEFESLKYATGAEYVKHRRGLVIGALLGQSPGGASALRSFLLKRAAEKDWRTATTATILLGWLEHNSLYGALEEEIISKDPRDAPDLAMVVKRDMKTPDDRRLLVPFAWEGLLKHHEDWEREKRAPLFKILEEQPVQASIDVLFYYVEELAEGCSDRTAALRPLKRQPAALVKLRAGATARLRVAADDALAYLDIPLPKPSP